MNHRAEIRIGDWSPLPVDGTPRADGTGGVVIGDYNGQPVTLAIHDPAWLAEVSDAISAVRNAANAATEEPCT